MLHKSYQQGLIVKKINLRSAQIEKSRSCAATNPYGNIFILP